MTSKSLHYSQQWLDAADVDAVAEVLRGDWLTTGPAVEAFESAVADHLGCEHAIAVSSGTAALHLCALVAGVQPGDIAVTSPLTFLATANAFAYCGARPDFVDIDADTLCLSTGELVRYIERHGAPRVVAVIDYAGLPAPLPALYELAQEHNFMLIEDAAHAIGSTYDHDGDTYACGSCAHSDLAIFSFHPVKTITCGEGGMVTTNDAQLAKRIRQLAHHGVVPNDELRAPTAEGWYYEMHELGFNYRITDMQCALGSSQLRKLASFKARRTEIVRLYSEAFTDVAGVTTMPVPVAADPCYHLYVVRLKNAAQRSATYRHLQHHNVGCQVHYIPVHLQPYYRECFGYAAGKCPVAEAFYERCLSLPLYPAMTDGDVARVVELVAQSLEP